MSIDVVAEAGLGDGVPCFCRSVLTCADDRFSVNIRSGPYYRTGHRKSVKIRKNSYGWQLCERLALSSRHGFIGSQ